MTDRVKRVLLALVSGSALTIVPLACAAIGHADVNPKCDASAPAQPAPPAGDAACTDQPQPQAQGQGLNCPDGTIVDTKNNQCVNLTEGIAKQLRALPPPPGLAGFGGGGAGGLGDLGGIPSLGTINLPSVVLPSLSLGLVPDINVNLQPKLPSFNPLNLP